jgi:putative phosphoesterase
MAQSNERRIGVLSDTHIPTRARSVPQAALDLFTLHQVDLIIHAGDVSTMAVINQLSAYAPVEAVQGNVEFADTVAALPIKRELVVGGCAIGIVHSIGAPARYRETARREFPDARVVVFGHSHVPLVEDAAGLLLLNPGSATDRRSQPHCTVALLTVSNGVPSARILALP